MPTACNNTAYPKYHVREPFTSHCPMFTLIISGKNAAPNATGFTIPMCCR